MYDYGARMYMPDIGRWGVQDQLSEKFFSNSNYNYVGNNPILIFDPDGRDWYYTNDGQYVYSKDLTKDNATQFFKDNNIEGKYAFASNKMGNMNYAADGKIYDDSPEGEGKAVEFGTREIEAVHLVKPVSLERKTWNMVTDIVSKPIEGVQVIGYIFYGGFYALPKKSIEEGKVEGVHVDMDIITWGFKNGKFHKNVYKDDDSMSEADKFDAFFQPGIEAMTAPLSFGLKPFKSAVANFGVNAAMKTGAKKAIYQAKPKKEKK